jgi:hypothetical protein
MRSQPYPAVGTELPLRFNLVAALEALLEELVKFFMELQECGLHLALLRLLTLLRVVHCLPFVSPYDLPRAGNDPLLHNFRSSRALTRTGDQDSTCEVLA